jgi:hypothetical protein
LDPGLLADRAEPPQMSGPSGRQVSDPKAFVLIGLRLHTVMPGLDPGIHEAPLRAEVPDGLPGQARQ